MKNKYILILILISVSTLPAVFAAHWIVGYVQNSTDNLSPNGRIVKLWNSNGSSDEITDIIGPNGNSLTSNIYMIDCELLNISCFIGDNLSLTLVDDESGRVGLNTVNVTVTGAGFDIAENLTMNSAPNITNVTVDDYYTAILEEIDLTPANTTLVYCTGIIEEFENFSSISNITAQFYANTSYYNQADDNNYHYTNNTCLKDDAYGNENQTFVNCSFTIEYYSNSGLWLCTINATDSYTASNIASDFISINTLLAIGTNNTINYSLVNANAVSPQVMVEITNYGNVKMNLSLSGFGNISEDGNSMNCDGGNISIDYTKYNLTASNPEYMGLTTFETLFKNLTSYPTIEPINLDNRQNDLTNEAHANIYWRVFVPASVGTTCQGNIIMGATLN
jgi:hypothetical protein